MRLGRFDVHALSDGTLRLDGGAMFGIIPKPLWERRIPADEANRIELGLHPLLVRSEGSAVLLDTGMGDKFDEKARRVYEMRHEPTLAGSLAALGLGPEDIDTVVLTHLHFDHCGGNTVRDADGTLRPAFPRARYVVQRKEWEYALAPDRRSRASYLEENLRPVEEAGLLRLIDGEAEAAPGVRCVPTPGHTAGHQSVVVEDGGETLVFLGDLVPTPAHMDPPYIMAYDVEPLVTLREKERMLAAVVEGGWLAAFEHARDEPLGRVTRPERRFVFEPLPP